MKLLTIFALLLMNIGEPIKKGRMGTATYYADKFVGRRTATEEIYTHKGLTAASNIYPLNSWVLVTNPLTCDSVVVRINDRMAKGMEHRGRIIDLTTDGAKIMNFFGKGVMKVKTEEFIPQKLKWNKQKAVNFEIVGLSPTWGAKMRNREVGLSHLAHN